MRRALIIIAIIFVILIVALKCWFTMRMSDNKAEKEFNKAGVLVSFGTLFIQGRHLHFAKTGSDTLPTIVFIHGSPGSWRDYKQYMMDSDLLKHFRIISIDRPGFGQSDYGQALSLQPQADIIGPFLIQLQNGKPLYLVGHSYGGPLVALLAADYARYINGIVILAGALDPSLEGPEKWRLFLNNILVRYLMPTPFRTSNRELMDLKTDLYPLQKKLPNITCDVAVLHGRKDMLVDVGNADYIKKQFTHAKSINVTYFPKENHFIPWTQFEAIKKVLLKFPDK